jgi:hypothetical protein
VAARKDLALSFLARFSPAGAGSGRTSATNDLTAPGHSDLALGHTPANPPTGTPTAPTARVRRPWRKNPLVTNALSVLACAFVLFGLVVPNQLGRLSPEAFLRIPVEGLIGLAVLVVLPVRIRQLVAAAVGVVLALLTIVKIIDMGFYDSLNRPFSLVFDWSFFGPGLDFLKTSVGRTGEIATVIGVLVLVVVVVVLMTLSVIRVSALGAHHRPRAAGALGALGVAWIVCAALGAQFVTGEPIASTSAATLTFEHAKAVHADLQDKDEFAQAQTVDAFAGTPANQLLTGLRGKDVLLTFVESYGQSAVEDPKLAPIVDPALEAGTASLKAAGFASESGWLTSPTYGGGSWFAHSTLLSGLWVDNQQRYNTLVKGNRLTLTSAFAKADWRTAAVVPDVTTAWPEGKFYGYDKIYAVHDFGYAGPSFGWATMPDQFALQAFQNAERANPHAPLMAEMALVSSHAPWAPIPSLVNWKDLGDGSIFDAMKKNQDPVGVVWRDSDRVRTQYAQSIAYSVTSVVQYMEKYGDKNTVLIFLGDHQPAPIITGSQASHNVPITIVAKDPAVLKRISGWNWTDGLKPGPQTPVWPMSAFRDRFLTAFGS